MQRGVGCIDEGRDLHLIAHFRDWIWLLCCGDYDRDRSIRGRGG